MRYSLVTVALIVAYAATVSADEVINSQTLCRSVRTIFDAAEPDLTKVRAVAVAIDREFRLLDRENAVHARPQIYARMNDKGKQSTSAAVTVRCEEHPSDTLKNITATVYKGIEAIGDAMRVNE